MIDIFIQNRLFFRFFIARVISQVGDGIQALAILWLSYKWSNSALVVGFVMVASSLPAIVISPFAGYLADRINRIKIMVFADIVRFILVGILAALSYKGILNIQLLIGITIFISIASAYFNPSSMAVIPQIVKTEYIVKANALAQISSGFSVMLGPAIGVGLIALIGISWAFLINSISFLFSALLIGNINLKKVGSINKQGLLESIKSGFELLKSYPVISKMLDKVAVINFFFASISIVIPVFAGKIYHMDAKGMGIMMSAFGFGVVFASVFLSFVKLKINLKINLVSSITLMGLAFIVFGIIYKFYISLACITAIGFLLNYTNVNIISFYQEVLPNEILGRTMAFLSAISLSLQPISYGVMGALIDWVGLSWVLVFGGFIIIVSGLRILTVKELEV